MLRVMEVDLSFPVRKSRLRMVDLPEICLAAAIVVAVKQALPFTSCCAGYCGVISAPLPHMNWPKWNEAQHRVAEAFSKDSYNALNRETIATSVDTASDPALPSRIGKRDLTNGKRCKS